MPELVNDFEVFQEQLRLHKEKLGNLGEACVDIGKTYIKAEKSIMSKNATTEEPSDEEVPVEYLEAILEDSFGNLLYKGKKKFFAVINMLKEKNVRDDVVELFVSMYSYKSRIKEIGIKNWFMQYVPGHVDDKTMLIILDELAYESIPSGIIEYNHINNMEKWKYYVEKGKFKFIENQQNMYDLLYGMSSADKNSCEVIAVYNALVYMNGGESNVEFPDLISEFEHKGVCAKGELGTSPIAVYDYFDANGYTTEMLYGESINEENLDNMQAKYDTFILTAYNDGCDLEAEIHTVCITEELIDGKKQFVIHNGYDDKPCNSLYEAVNEFHGGKSEPIDIICVK